MSFLTSSPPTEAGERTNQLLTIARHRRRTLRLTRPQRLSHHLRPRSKRSQRHRPCPRRSNSRHMPRPGQLTHTLSLPHQVPRYRRSRRCRRPIWRLHKNLTRCPRCGTGKIGHLQSRWGQGTEARLFVRERHVGSRVLFGSNQRP